ncbi:MAG: hypothetical protein ACOVJ5_02045 [Gloeomargaritales cyanobacterium]
MAAVVEVKYFNTFILKKVFAGGNTPVWGGSFGIPTTIDGDNTGYPISTVVPSTTKEWFIEEARIRGGYNNLTVDFGVKAYIVDATNTAAIRSSALIYSGLFNSRTGVNNTNQFSSGEEITKGLDPANGSIQRLYAEDTNLIIFQENKVSRALIDKDAIYSAEGAGTVTTSNVVIGQTQAYAGTYGISKDPGSFAVYGYRKYFTDRNRNAVLRLSQDGITEISQYGMTDYFRDEFSNIDTATYGPGKVIGGWDTHNKQYVLSTQSSAATPDQYKQDKTLGFSDDANGFTSFYSFIPSQILSLKSKFYTLNKGRLWVHYNEAANTRGNFYGVQYNSNIRFVFNEAPSNVKVFKTINYEGANGWQVDSFRSDLTGPDYLNSGYINTQDVAGVLTTPAVFSYMTGAYDDYGNSYPSTLYPPINRAGFDRKENKYMAVLMNKSEPNPEEISFGNEISGIKGYFAIVDMSLDNATDVGGAKELFAASCNYDFSVY